jgi:hypothetical protein
MKFWVRLSETMKMLTNIRTVPVSKLLPAVALFLISGIGSSILYYKFQASFGGFVPGIFYTCSTIAIFSSVKETFQIKKLLIYFGLMNLTYLAALLLTFFSFYFGFLAGIVTGGLGAIVSFMLANKYVVGIQFNKKSIFIWGGVPFIITDILYWVSNSLYDTTPCDYLFKIDISPGVLFFEVFIFWHVLVGTKLFLTVWRSAR